MSPQCFDEEPFPEFLSCIVERFSYAVGIECECVSLEELAFPDRAIPLVEESQHGARGTEPLKRVIAPEEKGRERPAIRVAQAPCLVVILDKEQGRIGAVGRILAKELVH